MTAATPDTEAEPSRTTVSETTLPLPPEPFVYTTVPDLWTLMPSTGGVPGVVYLQCNVTNVKRAQNEGWLHIEGRAYVYTIVGPKGRVDCQLYCKGTPIPGQGSRSGARECQVDVSIYHLTGLEEELAEESTEPKRSATAPPIKPKTKVGA